MLDASQTEIHSLRQVLARLEAVDLEAMLVEGDGHVHRHLLLRLLRARAIPEAGGRVVHCTGML